jgi:hypothetical protein
MKFLCFFGDFCQAKYWASHLTILRVCHKKTFDHSVRGGLTLNLLAAGFPILSQQDINPFYCLASLRHTRGNGLTGQIQGLF